MRGAVARAATPPLVAAAVLCGFAALASAGSSNDRLAVIGTVALLAAAAGVAAAAFGLLRRPAVSAWGLLALAFLAAFIAWNGLSILWSIAPDRSWDYFNRGLTYAAFLALGLYVGAAGEWALRSLATLLAAVAAVVVSWALAGKMVPGLAFDSLRLARLHTPIGYWNALALVFVMAVPVALWLAAQREHPHALRAAATVLLYAFTVALLLTYSRGGLLVAIVVVAVWLVVASPVLESAAALVVATVPGLAVALWSFTRPGISDDFQPHSVRTHDGAWFATVFVVVGVAVWAAAFLAARYEERSPLSQEFRRRLGRAGWGVLAAAVAAFAIWVGVTAKPRQWLRNFSNETAVSTTPNRLTTLNSSSRWQWWQEAWRGFEKRPLAGTGAGSFELTHRLVRKNDTNATEPHNVPLQFLSELGIVGLLLFVGVVVTAVLAIVRARARLEPAERGAATALALALLAWLLHAVVDFDWDFVAVTGPAFLILGALLAAPGLRAVRQPRASAAVAVAAAIAFAAVGVYSFGAPWLADRRTDSAIGQVADGSLRRAIDDARSAHDLNPLALQPLFAWASAEEILGHSDAARRLYVKAVDLQPLNWRSWYELAHFELDEGHLHRSLDYYNRAVDLDPHGPLPTPARNYVRQQVQAAGG